MFWVFYLTYRVLKAESVTIPIFIPICFDLGIILAMGSTYTWLSVKDSIQQYLALSGGVMKEYHRSTKLALLTFVTSALRVSQNHSPVLPISCPNNPIDADYTLPGAPARHSGESDQVEILITSEDGHTGEFRG